MENANSGGNGPKNSQEGKERQQTADGQKVPGIPHAWWEQLLGKLQDDKVGTQGWYRTLSNPLVVVVGLILMAYWLFVQKKGETHQVEKGDRQLRKEVKRLKKKFKKLQKGGFASGDGNAHSGVAVLD